MKKLEEAPNWLDGDFADQAVKLGFDENVKALVNHINENYYYWDKVKYQKNELFTDPKLLWACIKLSRVLNQHNVSFGRYKFTYNLTNTIQNELHLFDLHIGGNLGTKSLIPDDDKRKYLVSSIMEEAIASSQIEGAVTTRKKAKDMLRKNSKPRTKSEQMIVNNYITINHIVTHQNEALDLDKLFKIHKLIVSQTMDEKEDEGRFRDNEDVTVIDSFDGEIVHIPPPSNEVPALMQELIGFFNDEKTDFFMHPIIKGCILHFMIGYIHPFVDGNGRTARALFYWYLLKNGYWLTEYLSISRLIMRSKNQYAQAFLYTETDDNDLTYFINYKLKTMQLSYDSLREYIERKISEKKRIVGFQKIRGVNERQATIIKWLYEEPDLIFSVKEVENRMMVSNQTARTDLEGLVRIGLVEMVELNKKTKAFSRSDKFETILAKEAVVASS